MDAMVEAALRKWPGVPHCYGWLALDARGDWYMRDERVQAAGAFPHPKGSRIQHDRLLGFIHRNYALDTRGAAFFQNGPQRVYVELECTPWIWRLQHTSEGAAPGVQSHTGVAVRAESAWLDETGCLYLNTPLGLGLVHSLDMAVAADAVECGLWVPQDVLRADLPARFGFVCRPAREPSD
jgi:Protein of unknown function (DUF2946)